MTNDKYGVSQDPACYINSSILINILNITDADKLEGAEQEITAIRAAQWEPEFDTFNLELLQRIHRHLFQDIYSWAGEIRTVDISKDTTHFCSCRFIENEARKLFESLRKENYLTNLNHSQFIEHIADYYCELNVIHPFREGNGRAQRLFFEELIINAGWDVSWGNVARLEWIHANISGFEGDLSVMEKVFSKLIVTQ